jgi:large subunit ribosomal protein L17
MRHKKTVNHLSRKTGHRKAMLANMAASLIKHKRIETTTAKAKALKRYIEPLITRAKDDSTHSRRVVFSYLQDKDAVTELFREVGAKVADRPGGYTRIIKLGHRLGDSADLCLIELVDYNENLLAEKAAAKKSSGRRRRGSKKKSQETTASAATTATAEAAAPEAASEEAAPEATAEATAEASTEDAATVEAAAEEAPEAEAKAEEPAEAPEAEAKAEEPAEAPEAEAKTEEPEARAEEGGEQEEDEAKEDGEEDKKE